MAKTPPKSAKPTPDPKAAAPAPQPGPTVPAPAPPPASLIDLRAALSPPPASPLTDQQRDDYHGLYAILQAAVEDNASDPTAFFPLKDARDDVDAILTKDTLYRLQANTALYESLVTQIKEANLDLAKIKAEILAIDAKLQRFADVVAAIDKIITNFPALIP